MGQHQNQKWLGVLCLQELGEILIKRKRQNKERKLFDWLEPNTSLAVSDWLSFAF